MFCLFSVGTQNGRALGFFELQILEIENYRGQLATGECCGGGGVSSAPAPQQWPAAKSTGPPPAWQCSGTPQCNTLFQVCLREYQSQAAVAAAIGGRAAVNGGDDEPTAAGSYHHYHQHHHHQSSAHYLLHHCSFGNVTSPVLGGNSFTLGGDASGTAADAPSSPDNNNSNRSAAGGNLALPFSFSWTVSTTFVHFARTRFGTYRQRAATIVARRRTYAGPFFPRYFINGNSAIGRLLL